jgi:hypothetical protein
LEVPEESLYLGDSRAKPSGHFFSG